MTTKREIITLDASGQVVGRLASKIALILMGKHKSTYRPHIDSGDTVMIANVDQVVFTGKKIEQKEYRRHSMHPGGLKIKPARKVLKEDPRKVIIHAVTKMLPKNKLRPQRLQRISFK